VFVPSRDSGALVALTTSWTELWSVSTGGYVDGAPAVWRGEYVPVSGNAGRLLFHGYAFVWAVEPRR